MTLPPGWSSAALLDVVDLHDSRRIPLNAQQRAAMPGNFPYYGANGQVGTVGDYLFDGPHILVAEDGGFFDQPERGVAYEVDGKFWVNNHAHIMTVEKGVSQRYLARLLNTLSWLDYVSGTTRLKLTQGGMQRISLPLPPAAEQCRINSKLEALTASITCAAAELKRVSVLAANLRASAIIGAMRGDLTAQWREQHDLVALTTVEMENAYERIAGVRRRKPALPIEWKPEITIPSSWRWASVDEVVGVVQYGTSAKMTDVADGIAVLRMGNIQQGAIDRTKLKYLPASHDEFPALFLMDGDVLFNRTNSPELVGKAAVYRGSEPTSFASYLIRVRCASILPDLMVRYLNSPIGREWVGQVASQQVGQANVNGTKLRALGIPLPPMAEQIEINRLLNAAFARADRLEAEATRARALLDRLEAALLAKAFRGELVPQDPNDEPASVLLDRIRAERAAAPKPKRGRARKAVG